MPNLKFNPEKDIPDLKDKVILITGGTAGLGYQTVLSFAKHGAAHIFFTGRSAASAQTLTKDVQSVAPNVGITFVSCDMTSLASVQTAAKEVLSKTDRLDVFMANAGVMAVAAGQTKDGYETQFGINHMGNALLVDLLTPLLESTAKKHGDVRIIWNTSEGHGLHPAGGILFDKVKTPQNDIAYFGGAWVRYGQAKLANLLYARSYAKHHPTVTSVSIHPGVSATGLVTSLGFFSRMLVYVTNFGNMLTPEQCAYNQQWAATAPLGEGDKYVKSGVYYAPVGIKGKLVRECGNDELAEKLWEWTQKEFEGYSV